MHSWWNVDCSNHYISCVLHINRTATAIPHKTLITAEDIVNIITHKTCKKENLSSNNTTCLVKSQKTLWIKLWSEQKTLVPEEHKNLCRYGQEGWVESIENSLIPSPCNFVYIAIFTYAAPQLMLFIQSRTEISYFNNLKFHILMCEKYFLLTGQKLFKFFYTTTPVKMKNKR